MRSHIDWDSPDWGGHVHTSATGSWLPEQLGPREEL